MKFKILPNRLRKQSNNIINKNERLATNMVSPTPASVFDKSYRHLTTFDSNKLVPVFVDECLPGDIFKIDVSTLIRLSLPNAATMENPVYDISFFFVPNRIVWENWKYFMGENKDAGYQRDYKKIPIIDYKDYSNSFPGFDFKYNENDLASYIGIPINVKMNKIDIPVNSLFFKAYGKIWNDYYRDQNLQSEIDITNNNKNDENVKIGELIKGAISGFVPTQNVNYDKYFNKLIQIGKGLAPVSRLPDYFSTCLPYPQKGETVSIDTLPLKNLNFNLPALPVGNSFNSSNKFLPKYLDLNGRPLKGSGASDTQAQVLGVKNGYMTTIRNQNYTINPADENNAYLNLETRPLQNVKGDAIFSIVDGAQQYSINDLRLSLAIQHMRELDARGGTRYIEYLLNHFGVQSSDSRLDRAEMIGGFRDNINISNVVQSAPGINGSTTEQLGSLGGVSVTAGKNPRIIEYACKEHGIIIGLICVRPQINYSQGLDKKFTRIEKLDYYEPLLANIGEQPIKKYELFLDDNDNNNNNGIFGYNEPWADYRYSQNKLSGYMSVNSELSLTSLYAYTEKYVNAPVLGEQWMYPDKQIIGNTLLLTGTDANKNTEFIHQFLGDFYFSFTCERKMPVYSIPGLKRI